MSSVEGFMRASLVSHISAQHYTYETF